MDTPSVARTYRAAIKLGDNFVTIEETVTLPTDASDDQIAAAVDLGWRIFAAQHEVAAQQIARLRESLPAQPQATGASFGGAAWGDDAPRPASEKQRNYIARLQDNIGWSSEQLAAMAMDEQIDLAEMSTNEASLLIDKLKAVETQQRERTAPRPAARAPQPAARPAPRPAARNVPAVGGVDSDDDIPF